MKNSLKYSTQKVIFFLKKITSLFKSFLWQHLIIMIFQQKTPNFVSHLKSDFKENEIFMTRIFQKEKIRRISLPLCFLGFWCGKRDIFFGLKEFLEHIDVCVNFDENHDTSWGFWNQKISSLSTRQNRGILNQFSLIFRTSS